MRIGSSLTLVAVGLILAYAVDFEVPGLEVWALGAILFYVGLLGLLISIGLEVMAGRARRPPRPRPRAEAPRREPAPREAYDPVLPRRPPTPRHDAADDRTRVLGDQPDEETRRLS